MAAFFALVDRLVAARNPESETLAAQAGELFAPADPQGDAVQMMTIHKSKGLEFDTVILPGLHRETGGGDSNLLLWDEVAGADGDEHLLVAPMRQKGSDLGEPTAYDTLRRLEGERAAHETERLLYVAATRAIRRLHLVGVATADDRKDDGLKPPPAATLLKLLWPGVAQPVFAAALDGVSTAARAAVSIRRLSFRPCSACASPRCRKPCTACRPVCVRLTTRWSSMSPSAACRSKPRSARWCIAAWS